MKTLISVRVMNAILSQYGFDVNEIKCNVLNGGLINSTWSVEHEDKCFILQRINHSIFKCPEDIDYNIKLIDTYINGHLPSYIHLKLIPSVEGSCLVRDPSGFYYRIFEFLDGATYDVLDSPSLAFEAARKFGEYTRILKNVSISDIRFTLPNFHNLTLRVKQYQQSLSCASSERLESASKAIDWINAFKAINAQYEQSSIDIKLRITHHDTKISNVLFDHNDKGLCVIDLDTVMPGDMFRTYLSPASEEETDLTKVFVRMDYFTAIVRGYLRKFMMYMQALRFLTDYLNNDIYYGAKYEGHNLNRALNQLTLLQSFVDHEPQMWKVLKEEFNIHHTQSS